MITEPASQAPRDNAAFLSECPHFADCGGCTDVAPKDRVLPLTLAAAGFAGGPTARNVGSFAPEPPSGPSRAGMPRPTAPDGPGGPSIEPWPCLLSIDVSPPNSRRRMDLAVRRAARGVELGLHRHRSHDVVDLRTCRVLHPDLVALFDPLRAMLDRSTLLRTTGDVVANRLDNGVDLLLRTDQPATAADRTRWAEFAALHGISRVSHAVGAALPETLAMLRAPVVTLSGVAVQPPPGAFLQATAQGEAAILAAVIAGLPAPLGRRDRIADLYAGCGTISFALAAHAGVDAFEGDAPTYAALTRALRDGGLAGRVAAHHRDLVRQPLQPRELASYAAVVMDPPAAGAPNQIATLIEAKVPRLIYVSCDPATLQRDARKLRLAGFQLLDAAAMDQFIGAPRVESVCVFQGPRRPRVRTL